MRFSSLKTIILLRKPPFSTQTAIRNFSHDCSDQLLSISILSLIHASKTACHLKQTHAQIIRHGLSQNSRVISSLISTCSLFKSIDYALSIFRHSRDPGHSIFISMIEALYYNGRFADSISHFSLMRRLSIRTDSIAFYFAIESAESLLEYRLGGALHASIIRLGLDVDSLIWNALAFMYGTFGLLYDALMLISEIPENLSVQLGNHLISEYIKGGNLELASKFFEYMSERNERSWATMVVGFSRNGDHVRAVITFFEMLDEGVEPNDDAVISALLSCARMGSLYGGIRIHDYVLCNGFQINGLLGSALVDMYSMCGEIEFASWVFCQIEEKDVGTWRAMISGWAIHGFCEEALQCFVDMKSAGTHPDEIVFLEVLKVYSQSGLVDQVLEVLESMTFDYSIEPTVEHYAYVVDVLAREGHLEEVLDFIESMPIQSDFVIWGTFISALAEFASNRLFTMCMAENRKWEDVTMRVRNLMKIRSTDESQRCSFIEVEGRVYRFTADDDAADDDDRAHTHAEEIYKKLDEMGGESVKKALSYWLRCTSRPTVIRIVTDLRVCGDCHSLLKQASMKHHREIVLRDIERFHHFKDGDCTCEEYYRRSWCS